MSLIASASAREFARVEDERGDIIRTLLARDFIVRPANDASPSNSFAFLGDGNLTMSHATSSLITSDEDVITARINVASLDERIPAELRSWIFGGESALVPEERPALTEPPLQDPVDCAITKCVALTFDDGPGIHTARLLDTLKAEEVAATFFLVGHRVAFHPGDLQRMIHEGHEVGNHSWTHPQLTRLSNEAVRTETQRTNQAIEAITGRPVALFRPPYGLFNARVRDEIDMPIILWNHDTLDWRALNAQVVARRTASGPGGGSIILLHDIHKTTVDAMPKAIADLKAQGYSFVTLSTLFAPHVPVAKVVYEERLESPALVEK